MKKIILLLILHSTFFTLRSFAQPAIQWQKCLGGTIDDYAYSIQQTTDGGYVVAGYAGSNNGDVTGNHGGGDSWVVKLDNSGNIQWQKCLGGTDADGAYSIRQTTDGGYIVAGSTDSNDGDVTGNHSTSGISDYWILKLSSTGSLQWQKCFGGTASDGANSIDQTSDGGYIVVGGTSSNNGDVTGYHGGFADYWIVKLNSSGNLQWQKCLGGTALEAASSVEQTADGGYIVAGYTESNNGDITGYHGLDDYWLVKLDSTGNIQWQKCLGGIADERANSVQQTADGGYIVAGFTESIDGNVMGNHGNWECWTVKLDGSGNIQWQKCLGETRADYANSVQQTTDGGFIIAGSTASNDGDVAGNHDTTGFSNDYWIVKLDSSGNFQWQKCIGGTGDDRANSVQQTSDGGYIIVGNTMSSDGDVTGNHDTTGTKRDYWVVKLSPSVGIEEETSNFFIKLFPNPATNELTVGSSKFGEIKIIEIYSSIGEKRLTLNPSPKERDFRLDVSFLSSGIYFITVTDQAGNKGTKKVVKM